MTTAVTKRMKIYIPPETIPPNTLYFDAGGTTYHTHTCPEDGHKWMCNSPYCASLNSVCPDHGGEDPFSIGREPWRR